MGKGKCTLLGYLKVSVLVGILASDSLEACPDFLEWAGKLIGRSSDFNFNDSFVQLSSALEEIKRVRALDWLESGQNFDRFSRVSVSDYRVKREALTADERLRIDDQFFRLEKAVEMVLKILQDLGKQGSMNVVHARPLLVTVLMILYRADLEGSLVAVVRMLVKHERYSDDIFAHFDEAIFSLLRRLGKDLRGDRKAHPELEVLLYGKTGLLNLSSGSESINFYSFSGLEKLYGFKLSGHDDHLIFQQWKVFTGQKLRALQSLFGKWRRIQNVYPAVSFDRWMSRPMEAVRSQESAGNGSSKREALGNSDPAKEGLLDPDLEAAIDATSKAGRVTGISKRGEEILATRAKRDANRTDKQKEMFMSAAQRAAAKTAAGLPSFSRAEPKPKNKGNAKK